MVLLLLILCLLLLQLWESVIVLCFFVCYFMSILVCNHLDGEERELVALHSVFMVSPDGCVALPCDCGIYWSYSLTIPNLRSNNKVLNHCILVCCSLQHFEITMRLLWIRELQSFKICPSWQCWKSEEAAINNELQFSQYITLPKSACLDWLHLFFYNWQPLFIVIKWESNGCMVIKVVYAG